jgi:hypothetical protein
MRNGINGNIKEIVRVLQKLNSNYKTLELDKKNGFLNDEIDKIINDIRNNGVIPESKIVIQSPSPTVENDRVTPPPESKVPKGYKEEPNTDLLDYFRDLPNIMHWENYYNCYNNNIEKLGKPKSVTLYINGQTVAEKDLYKKFKGNLLVAVEFLNEETNIITIVKKGVGIEKHNATANIKLCTKTFDTPLIKPINADY